LTIKHTSTWLSMGYLITQICENVYSSILFDSTNIVIGMKTIELKCVGCNLKFLKELKEYNRQSKKGNLKFFCNKNCSCKHRVITKLKTFNIERLCLFCNKKFISTTHKKYKKCCSITCARRYSQTYVDKKIISESVKKFHRNNPKFYKFYKHKQPLMEDRTCTICNKLFNHIAWKRKKTCSNICYKRLLSINATKNPNCGGETNFKKFKYNDIWMDSSWEVEIAKWMDIHNVKWERSKKINFIWTDFNGKKRRYYPDFYLKDYNVYLDPKNKYLIEKDTFKIEQVQKENNIKVIFGLKNSIIEYLENLIKL